MNTSIKIGNLENKRFSPLNISQPIHINSLKNNLSGIHMRDTVMLSSTRKNSWQQFMDLSFSEKCLFVFLLPFSITGCKRDNLFDAFEADVHPANIQSNHGKVIISPQKDKYKHGEVVTIQAIPDKGYVFHEMSIDGHTFTSSIINYEVFEPLDISVVYDPSIDISNNEPTRGTVNVSSMGPYTVGQVITITAKATDRDYYFSHFVLNGTTVNTISFNHTVTDGIILEAYFYPRAWRPFANPDFGSPNQAAAPTMAIYFPSMTSKVLFTGYNDITDFAGEVLEYNLGADIYNAVGIDLNNPDNTQSCQLAIDSATGRQYFAYLNNSGELYVQTRDTGSWSVLRGIKINDGISAGKIVLKVSPTGVPYVVYNDDTLGTITCKRWNGSTWDYLTAMSPHDIGIGNVTDFDMDIDPATGWPVIHYTEPSVPPSGRSQCKTFDGTSWVNIGSTTSISFLLSSYNSLALTSAGVPIAAYRDSGVGNHILVNKWDGVAWVNIESPFSGSTDITGTACRNPKILIDRLNGDLVYLLAIDDSTNDLSLFRYDDMTHSWDQPVSAGATGGIVSAYDAVVDSSTGSIIVTYVNGSGNINSLQF